MSTHTASSTSVETQVAALGTILSIWAHPDDETYLAGATMAAARALGQRVVCASATAGEHGTDDPQVWPPERLGAVRRWEAAAAMAVLGVHEHAILGLPDGGLSGHADEGRAWVRRLIDEVAPDTILTFGPDGSTFHPDHLAVHRWVCAAWAESPGSTRLLHAVTSEQHLRRFGDLYEEWGVYMSDDRPVGTPASDLVLDLQVDGALLDRKLTALRAMATQTGEVTSSLDPDLYAAVVRDECFVDAARPPRDEWDRLASSQHP